MKKSFYHVHVVSMTLQMRKKPIKYQVFILYSIGFL
jgi:hypothetical protein